MNQNDLYPDTEAIEDRDLFVENLPPLHANESDNELDELRDKINPGSTKPTFSDVYVPEVVARRAAMKPDNPIGKQTQTLARSRQPQMEIDRPPDEGVSYTPVPATSGTKPRDNSADSHVKNTRNEPARLANRRKPSLQTDTDRTTVTGKFLCSISATSEVCTTLT